MTFNEKIVSQLKTWIDGVKRGDIDFVAKLYHKDATLMPTMRDVIADNNDKRIDYFNFFLGNGGFQDVIMHEHTVRQFSDEIASICGNYDFLTFEGDVINSRYTFVYQNVDGKWKIIAHHSSFRPQD